MLLELRTNVLPTSLRMRRFYRAPLHMLDTRLAGTLSAAIATSVLSGCAATYQMIDGPLAAPLSFSNETSRPLSVHLYGGSDECTSRLPLGPLVQSKEVRRTAVMSGQEVTFTVGQDLSVESSVSGLVQKGCLATLTFRPAQGKSYRFRFFSVNEICSYQLSESLGDGSGARLTPFVSRSWVRAITESGPFCKRRALLP
jgi:hypothetical protein